jgi:starch-binding outer membrane protein, SusD/RagB family
MKKYNRQNRDARCRYVWYRLFIFLVSFVAFSCKKYLDEKPDKSLVVPQTVADVQALLDDNSYMNNYGQGTAEASADNYYLTDADWAGLPSEGYKNTYTWGDELFFDQFPNEWASDYQAVFYANVVLDALDEIAVTNQNKEDWNNAKGSALFYRARVFHSIAVGWSKGYDDNTADMEPGIPLRLNANFNEPSERATINETYSRIITDLKNAIPLLPVVPRHVIRPSKPAAYALLSRVYLSMQRYVEAGLYADSSLQLKSSLIDYNGLNASANFPLSKFNDEVLFHCSGSQSNLSASRAKIDSALYDSYVQDDLRKNVFFKSNGNGSYRFKGNYSGSSSMFLGIAIDEMYLTKAECLTRNGNIEAAMNTLNNLMVKRWKSGLFVPFTAGSQPEALNIILTERRKELLMRDLRWMDIKRLNLEGAGITLKRILNGQVYLLPAGDNKFALPIPEYVIAISAMEQNPR